MGVVGDWLVSMEERGDRTVGTRTDLPCAPPRREAPRRRPARCAGRPPRWPCWSSPGTGGPRAVFGFWVWFGWLSGWSESESSPNRVGRRLHVYVFMRKHVHTHGTHVIGHHQGALPADVLRQQGGVPFRQQPRADVDGVRPVAQLHIHHLHRPRLLLLLARRRRRQRAAAAAMAAAAAAAAAASGGGGGEEERAGRKGGEGQKEEGPCQLLLNRVLSLPSADSRHCVEGTACVYINVVWWDVVVDETLIETPEW